MPERIWTIWLPEGFRIEIIGRTEAGRWVVFAVVLIGDDICIARYDTAHGIPHRDLIGQRSGLLEKTWYENVDPNEVFRHAIADFSRNYQWYYDRFRQG